ncbi:MAG: hypothetical protein KKB51_06630 [Candidatus Riflebacteria bacterium]|nr:hypothetical protein [Candidatus Riflebacteria bacterium]
MSRLSRKFVSVLILFVLLLQPFVPLMVHAEEAQNQKTAIEQAVADYQKTYDEIMAIDECELGSVSKWVIGAIDDIKAAWNKATDFAKNVWNSRPTWMGGDSDEEKAAKKAAAEAEAAKLANEKKELEGYLPQIEKANADIKKIKADAQKTMDLLKSGAFEEASKTDPAKVYNSLDANASGLAIYQKALREAGGALLTAADALSTATTILSAVSLVCTGLSVFVPIAPVTGPIAAVTKGAATATGIAAAILKAAGNTLVAAADKAITGDKEFLTLAGKEATKAAAEQAISRVVSKGVGQFAGDYAQSLTQSESGQKIIKAITGKVISTAIAPTKKELINTTKDIIEKVPEDVLDRIELPPASLQPNLSW